MPGFYGADIEQLRALAKTMSRHSERMTSLSLELGNLLTNARWDGCDAATFRASWNSGTGQC